MISGESCDMLNIQYHHHRNKLHYKEYREIKMLICIKLPIQLKSKLGHLVLMTALKTFGHEEYLNRQYLYENCTLNQVQKQKIMGDQTHFLYSQYEMLPYGRRYRVPLCKLNW